MNKYVIGIGAANVDIYGKSDIKIRQHFDHPSIIKASAGGVTRNVLENIARLGLQSKLLTAVGDDTFGELVIKKSKEAGIDTDDVLIVKNQRTGTFMQVQDSNNDMHLALCDMSISKSIDIKYIRSKDKIIKNASSIVLDPSLDNEVIEYVISKYHDVPIYLDPISDVYAKKIKPHLKGLYCIKPNIKELEVLVNKKLNNDNEIIEACKKLTKKGIKHIFVSLGKKGCLYVRDDGVVIRKKFKPVKTMKNASGAGDSFLATVIYCFNNDIAINDTIDLALAAGIVTISDERPINPNISIKLLRKIIKEDNK